jgi:cytochrome d ubiquinol oxidase subunit I
MDALVVHRFQFAFTIVYHYLFPQLTMGLAIILAWLWTKAYRGDETARIAARFWSKIFALNFVMGVVTGIPMEFQFGTNWSRFSGRTGEIIGQTLAMEGIFAFVLESAFLYLLIFREKHLSRRAHLFTAWAVAVGTWLSGWFIVCTNAFMQHPQGYSLASDQRLLLESPQAFLFNPWALVQYPHTMLGSLVTASCVVAGVSALFLLRGVHEKVARLTLTLATRIGIVAALAVAFPTGDLQAKLVAHFQPATFAAMEGHFHSEGPAGLTIIGQPNLEAMRLDNPLVLPRILSVMTHARWDADIPGLDSFAPEQWPTQVALLYYSYHIMVGIGTMLIALFAWAAVQAWRKRAANDHRLLWALMLAMPLPYIANTAGWMTAELGRQPWLVYGVMRTSEGSSLHIGSGTVYFSLLGFMGMYALLSIFYLGLLARLLINGPQGEQP